MLLVGRAVGWLITRQSFIYKYLSHGAYQMDFPLMLFLLQKDPFVGMTQHSWSYFGMLAVYGVLCQYTKEGS